MGTTFVNVPSDAILRFLESKGFRRREGMRIRELVYERPHAGDPNFIVLVYTSVRGGSQRARGKGRDAIRVCAIRILPSGHIRGVAKLPRVHRTGSVDAVLERVLDRMREAYQCCSNIIVQERLAGG